MSITTSIFIEGITLLGAAIYFSKSQKTIKSAFSSPGDDI
jgi:hypothetical protein